MSDEWTFQGVRNYIKGAAQENYPDMHPSLLGRSARFDAVTRANDALTQACHAHPDHRRDIAAEAERQRDVLALALEGVEAAILDVYSQLELPAPKFAGGEGKHAGVEHGQAAPPRQVPEWQPPKMNPKRGHDASTLAPHAPAPPKEEAKAETTAPAPKEEKPPAQAPKSEPPKEEVKASPPKSETTAPAPATKEEPPKEEKPPAPKAEPFKPDSTKRR